MPTISTVATANLGHLAFIKALQKKHSNAVGFLPGEAVLWYLENEHVKLAWENDEPAGYVLGRPKLRYAPWCRPITQACISFDSQRRHHGFSLVSEVCHEARLDGQAAVQCWCAADLEANLFWQAMNFDQVCRRDPNNKRGRELILWRKQISQDRHPRHFEIPPVAGWKAAKIIHVKP